MSITKAVNSKANTKSYSSADLPTNLAQPVIARYSATSTVSQAAITLTFLVDQSNTDAFMLYVDGKLLTIGTGNDYVFAAIDQNNTSSQITLNQILPAGLNIQAYKLGLKKESEFSMDNRFVNVYESLGKSFQPFVDQSSLLTAVNGTPSATQFRSTITNRASIPDISANLKAHMGVERIMTQQIVQLQNEFGPNGEPVYSVVNDDKGLIRFVGTWLNNNDSNGQFPGSTTTGSYCEVTFYGTGLNALIILDSGTPGRSLTSSTDGATAVAISTPTSLSTINARNYSSNQLVNVASGLTLGLHTVKINITSGGFFYGFEVLNESSTIKVTPGVSYSSGGKVTSSLSTLAYNSTFESGTLGTRGGRVLVYQKSDGTIAKALTATNAAQANLTAADHTNEEVARTYLAREFGAGRNDDFSLLSATARASAFTLDDGTTSLVGNSVAYTTGETLYGSGTTSFIALTFVGTGLDIFSGNSSSSGATVTSIFVDGVSIGTISYAGVEIEKWRKIVSGLPYGTHNVRLVYSSGAGTNLASMSKFIVYQPKKPTLPTGAIELADYNIMADFVASTGSVGGPISSGALFKSPMRELTYVGTWAASAVTVQQPSGFAAQASATGSYFEYTFFGTGIESHLAVTTASSVTVLIDGVNYTGSATVTSGGTWTSGTSTLAVPVNSGSGCQFQVTGLTLGLHKIRITTASANTLFAYAVTVITPIHSAKSNLNFDAQNTLPVGSQGISDNRAFTPVKDVILQKKNIAQAVGITSSPTTTSTVAVPCPDMSLTHYNTTGRIKISYIVDVFGSVANINPNSSIYLDGVQVGSIKDLSLQASIVGLLSDFFFVNVSPGYHKIDIYWYTNTGTITANLGRRTLLVEEQ